MGRGGRERGGVKGRKRKEKGKGRREGRERGEEISNINDTYAFQPQLLNRQI